jgi:hypothetical protein
MSHNIMGSIFRYLYYFAIISSISYPVKANFVQRTMQSDTTNQSADTLGKSILTDTTASSELADTAVNVIVDTASQSADTMGIALHADHIIRGERLFYGLVYFGERAVNCAGCHNMVPSDTLNWNPSGVEIAQLYKDKGIEELSAVLLKPRGKKMAEVHANINITAQDVIMLKAFMDHAAETGMKESKPVINRLLLFVFLIIVVIFTIADLVFFRKIRWKWVHMVLLLLSLMKISDMVVEEAIAIGRSEFYEPDQPVKFSHIVHAHDNQTECLYCHSTAEYGHSAGIPYVDQCMNCHIIVREGTNSGQFEINKVVAASENNVPIRWVRVYSLPDHVFFSHAQHVGAASLDCSECHGEVESMHKIKQVYDLSMGWCINCHRTTEVNILDNDYYSNYMRLREEVESGRIDMVTASSTGGTDCMKCHY